MMPLRSPEFHCVWQNGTTSRESFAATNYSNFVQKGTTLSFGCRNTLENSGNGWWLGVALFQETTIFNHSKLPVAWGFATAVFDGQRVIPSAVMFWTFCASEKWSVLDIARWWSQSQQTSNLMPRMQRMQIGHTVYLQWKKWDDVKWFWVVCTASLDICSPCNPQQDCLRTGPWAPTILVATPTAFWRYPAGSPPFSRYPLVGGNTQCPIHHTFAIPSDGDGLNEAQVVENLAMLCKNTWDPQSNSVSIKVSISECLILLLHQHVHSRVLSCWLIHIWDP